MNSNDSRRSSCLGVSGVAFLLLVIVSGAAWYFYTRGYLLYYGDAAAHLNISRSWIDTTNPGYDQIGTVWLPVLHVLCLPFVSNGFLWQTGLAGTIPVASCFVVAGVCFYLCGKDTFQSSRAALVALLCFAFNPNILYLATISMTEIVFMAGLTVCLLSILWFRRTRNFRWVAGALLASWWMSLTRYDGWFLVPFIALFLAISAKDKKLRMFISTGVIAALAPIYWLAHNWWETGNALDFYNGPYSAAAIQQFKVYEGFHNWPQAFHYYWATARLCCGDALLAAGIIGLLIALARGPRMAAVFLALTPFFYVWSVHSSWLPIRIPSLPPFGYYNSRYTLITVVLMSFGVGTLASVLPRSFAYVLALLTLLPWALKPHPDNWICWNESLHNSESRRAWTAQGAAYLKAHYRNGEGVLFEFGDLSAIFSEARISFKQTIHEGSGPAWFANTMPNGLVRQTKWALAQKGDKLALRLTEAKSFHVVYVVEVNGAPDLLIYERNQNSIY